MVTWQCTLPLGYSKAKKTVQRTPGVLLHQVDTKDEIVLAAVEQRSYMYTVAQRGKSLEGVVRVSLPTIPDRVVTPSFVIMKFK